MCALHMDPHPLPLLCINLTELEINILKPLCVIALLWSSFLILTCQILKSLSISYGWISYAGCVNKITKTEDKNRCQGSLPGVRSVNSNKKENFGAKTGMSTNTIKHKMTKKISKSEDLCIFLVNKLIL